MTSITEANELVLEIKNELSSNLAEVKYGAVCKFQQLVNRFPYPSALDPCFLKMLECFKCSDNYIRLAIFKVCAKCEKDLNKITCTELIATQIVSVMDCNDPVARAITLRFLGLFSTMCLENKNIHHVIFSQLDSNDLVECQSAVWAAQRYAKLSRSFAARLCPKLVDKLEALTTSTSYKLCFIPLCGYLHHEIQILHQIRRCLTNMITANQSTELVCALLNALTRLTSFSPIYASEQLALLLKHLQQETRLRVNLRLLQNMYILARKFPHVWTLENYQDLKLIFVSSKSSFQLKLEILKIFCSLASCPSPVDNDLWAVYRSVSVVSMSMNHASFTAFAIRLVSTLVLANTDNTDATIKQHQISLACAIIASAFSSDWHHSRDNTPTYFKMGLLFITKFLNAHPQLASLFVTSELFLSIEKEFPTSWQFITFIEFLCGIVCGTWDKQMVGVDKDSSTDTSSQLQFGISVFQLDILKFLSCDSVKKLSPENAQRVVLLLCALAFRVHQMRIKGGVAKVKQVSLNLAVLAKLLESDYSDCWLAYRVARLANKFSLHHLAASIYQRLLNMSTSAMLRHYFSSLWNLSNGFSVLRPIKKRGTGEDRSDFNVLNSLEEAYSFLLKSKTQLSCFRELKERFLWQFVCICSQFIHCGYLAHRFVNSLALQSTHELASVGQSFGNCSDEINRLMNDSVDADSDTLHVLQSYASVCNILRDLLIGLSTAEAGKANSVSVFHFKQKYEELVPLPLSSLSKSVQKLVQEGFTIPQLQVLLRELISQVMSVPFSTPRYCFQSLQTTEVKLISILPPSKSLIGDSITLPITGMVLQHGSHVFRRITHVLCTITVTSSVSSNQWEDNTPLLQYSQVVPVHRKVFTLQYVLSRSALVDTQKNATYTLTVRAQCQERCGYLWSAGCVAVEVLPFGR